MAGFKLYDQQYKRLFILPAILTIVFLLIIFVFPGMTLGLDFQGGTRVIVNTDQLQEQPVKDLLTQKLGLPEVKVAIVSSPFGTSARIEYAEPKHLADARDLLDQAVELKSTNPDQAKSMLLQVFQKLSLPAPTNTGTDELVSASSEAVNAESSKIANSVRQELITTFSLDPNTPFTTEQVTPTFGASFLTNTILVAAAGIALLTVVIFIFFREFIPSIAVVEAVLFDMLAALALLTLFNFSITLSTVAALLMMVGYSVDTDILLTTRLLKRKDKSVIERANDTLITGMTVTATLFGATLVMLTVSWFAQITIIYEISATILFGLIGDVIATWFTNAPILLWYWEKKHGSLSAS